MICINFCLPYEVVSLYHFKKWLAALLYSLIKGHTSFHCQFQNPTLMIIYMKKSNAKGTKHMRESDINYDG